MTKLIGAILTDLERAECIEFNKEDSDKLYATSLGNPYKSFRFINYLKVS